ncbi:hypothetical protein NE865_13912 [Phthorimaea operculella]|nr:hypothetical protein NE865_13912 [Phthorimaea operculella]
MQGFVPQLNGICDDFLELLRSCRRPDGAVAGFDQLTNRVGLECKYEADKMRPEEEPDKPTDHSGLRATAEQHLRRLPGATTLSSNPTSPQTIQGFVPQLNSICDDFLELLRSCRRPDGAVAGFDQLTNRVGLESEQHLRRIPGAATLGSVAGFDQLTNRGFVPQLNSICDDFLELLRSCRRPDGAVAGFDQLTNRVGLESEQHLRRLPGATTLGSVAGFDPLTNRVGLEWLRATAEQHLRRLPGATTFGFFAGFNQLTNRDGLESVCALMLGVRLGFLEKRMCGRAAALASAVKVHFRAQRDSYYGAPLWKLAPTTLYRSFVRSEETIHTVVSELMEEARNRKRGEAQDDGMREIFLKILDNPELDVRDKKAAIIDFITAGIETVSG